MPQADAPSPVPTSAPTDAPARAPDAAPASAPSVAPGDAGAPSLFRRLGPAGLLAVAWTFMPALMGTLLLLYMPTIADWLRGHQQAGYVLYIVIFIFSAGFGMLPTYSQSLLAGFAFGLVWGVPAALTGFVGAAMLGYAVAQRVSQHRVEREIEANPKARAIRDALIGHGFWKTLGVVALLRLPPNSPFALTNLVMSASGVPRRAFGIGTLIGMTPRTAAAVFVGTQIEDLTKAERPWWMFAAGLVLTLVVLAVIGWIAKKALDRVTQKPAGVPG